MAGIELNSIKTYSLNTPVTKPVQKTEPQLIQNQTNSKTINKTTKIISALSALAIAGGGIYYAVTRGKKSAPKQEIKPIADTIQPQIQKIENEVTEKINTTLKEFKNSGGKLLRGKAVNADETKFEGTIKLENDNILEYQNGTLKNLTDKDENILKQFFYNSKNGMNVIDNEKQLIYSKKIDDSGKKIVKSGLKEYVYDAKTNKIIYFDNNLPYSNYYDAQTGELVMKMRTDCNAFSINGKNYSYIPVSENKYEMYSSVGDGVFSSRWHHRANPEKDINGTNLTSNEVKDYFMETLGINHGTQNTTITNHIYKSKLVPQDIVYTSIQMRTGKFDNYVLNLDNGYKFNDLGPVKTDKNIAKFFGKDCSGTYNLETKTFENLNNISEENAKEFVAQALKQKDEIYQQKQKTLRLIDTINSNQNIFNPKNVHQIDTHYINSDILKEFA